MMQSRTHTCNALRLSDAGSQVTLVGWFENIRQVGFLTLVNRIIWQKPHNCGFFYVKFIKF